MHGHLFTCSLRAPVKVTTICTYAIELFSLKWIEWRQIKEGIRQKQTNKQTKKQKQKQKRQLMCACVFRECLEQK